LEPQPEPQPQQQGVQPARLQRLEGPILPTHIVLRAVRDWQGDAPTKHELFQKMQREYAELFPSMRQVCGKASRWHPLWGGGVRWWWWWWARGGGGRGGWWWWAGDVVQQQAHIRGIVHLGLNEMENPVVA
jgi:hypothetical protein